MCEVFGEYYKICICMMQVDVCDVGFELYLWIEVEYVFVGWFEMQVGNLNDFYWCEFFFFQYIMYS